MHICKTFFYTTRLKTIYFTVTNDLTYDQRMHRICGSLAKEGYRVTLVGRKLNGSLPLLQSGFRQTRLTCFFKKKKWFYAEYNIRLFFFLLFRKMNAICAIDLDTIMPVYYVSKLKRIPRVYDAHELFTEMKEVLERPAIHKTWLRIEKKFVPKFANGYTVSQSIAKEFFARYQVRYETIRNMPVVEPGNLRTPMGRNILYQGAVNEGRGLENLVPAMKLIDAKLVICGDGNFMHELKRIIAEHGLEEKIELRGMLPPDRLAAISAECYLAVAVPDKKGLNQWLALPNKFFDYMHAGLPQVTVNFPEYTLLNAKYEVAVLIDNTKPETIAAAVNKLLTDVVVYNRLRENCLLARSEYNWQNEELKLITFYKNLFTA